MGETYDDVTGKAEALSDATTTPMQELQAKINETKVALAPLGTTLLDLATTYLPPLIDGIQNLIDFFTNLPAPVQTAIVVAGLLAAGFLVLAPTISAVALAMIALDTSLLPIIAVIAAIIAVITAVVLVIQNWGAITEWLGGVWDAIKEKLSSVWNGIKETATSVFNAIKSFFTSVWNGIKSVVTTVVNAIKTTISNVFNAIKSTITNILNGIKSFFTSVWNGIKNTVTTVVNTIKTGAVNGFNSMVSGIKSVVSKIGTTIKEGFQTAIEFITSLPEKAIEWGANIIDGIIEGIKGAIGKIGEAVSSVAEEIVSFLPFSVVEVNPVSDEDEYAPSTTELLTTGISRNIGKIRATLGTASTTTQIQEYNVRLPYAAQGVIAPTTTSITNYERNRNVTNISTNSQITEQQYSNIISLLNKINTSILEKDTNTYMDGRRVSTVLKNVEKRKGYSFT